MISKKLLGLASLAFAASATASLAKASGELASCTITLHPNTGDALTDGLLLYTTVNLAGDTVTEYRDGAGRVRKRVIGAGADAIVTTQTFDARGNLTSVRDATGAGVDYAYDALSRKISETDAKIPGKVTTFAYDTANRLISKTDPAGVTTSFEYDLRDKLVKETTPMSATESRVLKYGYDGNGRLTSFTDANGGVTRWEFDSAGRNIAKTYPNGDRRTMEYDPAGRLVKLTDENGGIIASTYDLAGRLTAKHYSKDDSTDSFVYDATSRILSATKGRYGHTLTYVYDNAGRLAAETHPDGAVTRFEYDPANRLAKLAHTPAVGGEPTNSVLYGFDGRGLLATVSAGDYATRYEYRINGQLAATVDYRVATPQGDILRADRSYDAGARLLGVTNTAANGDQAGVVYTLGNDDQRLSATEETGARWNYTYDQLKQLTAANKTDTNATTIPPLDQSYAYDPMGNRRTYTEQGKTVAYTANAANQYSAITETPAAGAPVQTKPVYDKNGNMLSDGVRAYTWDADNQLTSVTPLTPAEGAKKVAFTYDWRGRRITKSVAAFVAGTWQAADNTDFKYHEWNPIEESIVAGSTTEKKNYVWGNDLSGNLHGAGGVGGLLAMKYNSDSYFYAYDGNGNVRALVKADTANPAASAITARYEYDGFGKEVAVTGVDADKNAFRFSTKQLDAETGMNYYGYRYYAVNAGRWINRDPIAERGGVNVYSMLGNSSVSNIDVLGMKPDKPCKIGGHILMLVFDGASLYGNGIGVSAVSGKPISETVTGHWKIPLGPGEGWVGGDYVQYDFDYSKARQKIANTGPIPEGTYWFELEGERSICSSPYSHGFKKPAWGSYSWSLTPENTETYGRSGFFIHGGATPGSAGCIDILGGDVTLHNLMNEVKNENEGNCYVDVTVAYVNARSSYTLQIQTFSGTHLPVRP